MFSNDPGVKRIDRPRFSNKNSSPRPDGVVLARPGTGPRMGPPIPSTGGLGLLPRPAVWCDVRLHLLEPTPCSRAASSGCRLPQQHAVDLRPAQPGPSARPVPHGRSRSPTRRPVTRPARRPGAFFHRLRRWPGGWDLACGGHDLQPSRGCAGWCAHTLRGSLQRAGGQVGDAVMRSSTRPFTPPLMRQAGGLGPGLALAAPR